MLNRKYFEKRLFYYEKFSDIDFCFDRCEDWDEFDCENNPHCEIYKKAKNKGISIIHAEFFFEKWNKEKNNRGLIDDNRVLFIIIGKQDISKLSERLKDLEYKKIEFDDFGYIIDKKEFYFGVNRYSRIFVYFALKCLKNPEILVSNSDKEYPLIIRNDKCTIYIAPKVNED